MTAWPSNEERIGNALSDLARAAKESSDDLRELRKSVAGMAEYAGYSRDVNVDTSDLNARLGELVEQGRYAFLANGPGGYPYRIERATGRAWQLRVRAEQVPQPGPVAKGDELWRGVLAWVEMAVDEEPLDAAGEGTATE